MNRPYVAIADCAGLARMYLKKANVHANDEDALSLADSIAIAISEWFGDMEHLTTRRPIRPRTDQ